MPASVAKKAPRTGKKHSSKTLMVRLDAKSKALLQRAAKLRHISVSDYVRMTMVAQAEKEVNGTERIIRMSPAGQLAFWKALHETPVLTPAQKELGRVMRGEE